MFIGKRSRSVLVLGIGGLAVTVALEAAQFDDIPVPAEMEVLEFMVGDWTVEGTFRTPDHIGDRTLWYLLGDGGVTRFDGTSWTAFVPGESEEADAVLAQVTERADPYAFSGPFTARPAQDGFALIIDEGRTSGTTLIYFDTAAAQWVSTAFHAPTNGVTIARASAGAGLPVFEGRATDRRGERIFRRRFERHGPDHFTIRTDISFDEGVTWIDDQSVQQVWRR